MLNLVVLILTVSNVWLVRGDVKSLVDEVCEGTPKWDVCHQCLDGAPGDTDKKGLAFRSIACSLATSYVVNTDLGNLARDKPEYKDTCVKCQQFIGVDAIQDLRTADSILKEEDDSVEAAKQVAAAIDKRTECSNLFPGIPDSQPFSTHFAQLRDLYANTQAILYEL